MAKTRSPGYPAIGLKEAIEKVRLVYNEDYQNKLPKLVMAQHMGYKGLNGASLPVLAALGKFGLIDGRGDQTWVSDLALAIIAHEPCTPQRVKAVKEAAETPSLFSELDEKFPGGKGSDAAIRAYLLTQKFIPEAADTAIRAYRETKELVEEESRGHTAGTSQENAARVARPREAERPAPLTTELGVPPNPPRPASARSQGMAYMVTEFEDRIVGDFEIFDRETAERLIKSIQRHLPDLPTRSELRAASEKGKPQPPAGADAEFPTHVANVPFMITQAQKAQLRQMGYEDDAIKKLTPEMAHSLLGLLSRN